MAAARRLVAIDGDRDAALTSRPVDEVANGPVDAGPGPVDVDVAVERALRALATVRDARRRLDEHEAELIADARRAGAPWRAVATARGLGTPQAGYQRAARLRARLSRE